MNRDLPGYLNPADRDTLWYKDAVIYQVHVKSFFDANGDGIGDFAGLIAKLDYIAALGVNTIWLLPFYPSPRRDDGYDIAEYRDVHPDYGTLSDARHFIAEAHKHHLRVITELVINHTSDRHPWFQRARAARPGSAARNYYVWSDTDEAYAGTRIIFCDTEKSNWTWDPEANAFYWHRFYSHQPDLNFDNPQVLKAVLGIMRFWLNLGVDGLRLDAIPYLVQREGTSNENLPETHAILKTLRAELDRLYTGRVLLAEANMWPEDVQPYFGGNPETRDQPGDECHMAFHFPLMPRMYMALAQEDRFPITDILRQTPEIPANCQWAIFLRNHDELTLEMVTDKERDYLWNYYASDSRARINLGIRRRLAPLVERDRRRFELLNTLLLSMPGTPVLYYGDEIGMGDNIHLGDRDGVRTPMQWSSDRNGGFSRADPASLVLPPIMDPLYGYEAVNVEAQSADRHSQLNWLRRMLEVRSQHRAFGRGSLKLLYPNNRKVLAYLREYAEDGEPTGETLLCVSNVSRSSQAVELDLSSFAGRVPVEMIGGATFPAIGQLSYLLTLQPYGFYWFVLTQDNQAPGHAMSPPALRREFDTLVLRNGAADLLQAPARNLLERGALPAYLMQRRWYAAKAEQAPQTRIDIAVELGGTPRPMLLAEIVADTAQGGDRYVLPLGFVAEDEATSALPEQLALARVRRGRRVGLLTDAFALPDFVFRVIELIGQNAKLACSDGAIHFIAHPGMPPAGADNALGAPAEVRYLSVEQSNSSVVIGNLAMLKLIRRCHPGIHPEAEMGTYLTAAGYGNIAPMLGEVTRIDAQGTPHVLAVLQGFIHNQGDAWQWVLDGLGRNTADLADLPLVSAVSAAPGTAGSSPPPAGALLDEALAEYAHWAANLGQRLGELHLTLARATDDAAFSPYPAGRPDTEAWARGAQHQIDQALASLAALKTHPAQHSAEERALAAELEALRDPLLARAAELAHAGLGAWCTRIHGDLHLGQILIAQGDAFFVDFEGEPARPLAQRRQRTSGLRDVAGMLRSFEYVTAVAASAGPSDLTESAQAGREILLRRFLDQVRQSFLDAYWSAANTIPHRFARPTDAQSLLDLFTLEKAAYEVCYESAHRPAWLGVPLRGLVAIARRLLKRGQTT
ncbi:maltose alpha-D-glucosyltransferase [Burkholderia sp. WAC0059]|uniref:maltose alpha-D-glucosyltransferase n=1 Tax=Burkholderia sp. WAC0059 TaxID=2066022 RepID=UPI000C7EC0B7|nr:maltose alpha-D-glucosyltransferase [Burkholderia sp. WAC0059]PLZ00603.1 maltose alpha-D-glucosyltransferase [Burkholderia sp. WAC0059]